MRSVFIEQCRLKSAKVNKSRNAKLASPKKFIGIKSGHRQDFFRIASLVVRIANTGVFGAVVVIACLSVKMTEKSEAFPKIRNLYRFKFSEYSLYITVKICWIHGITVCSTARRSAKLYLTGHSKKRIK